MEAIDVVFEGSETQVFLVGPSSVAVPGTVAGLEAAPRCSKQVLSCFRKSRQISERLGVAVRTVETHRERVMRKLDLPDSHALRSYATAHGLLAEASATVVSAET